MRRFTFGLILGLCLALLVMPRPATTQEIICAYPCACVCPTPTPTAAPTPAVGVLRIGHLTDLHAGAGNNNPSAIGYAVAALGAGADIVVETGDCTDAATSAQWALHNSWLATLTVPRYVVAGNHDAWGLPNGQPTAWAVDVAGYQIIGINGPFCSGPWLAAQWNGNPAVIVSHVPMSQISGSCRAAILSHGVVAFIHGHLHTNSISTASGVTEICTARGGLGNYRIIVLENEQIVP